MSIIESIKSGLKGIEKAVFYQQDIKLRAAKIIESISQEAQIKIASGLIDTNLLATLVDNPDQDALYRQIVRYIDSPQSDLILMSLSPTQTLALSLRQAESLRRRWFPDDPPITIDLTNPNIDR